jgi:hypothetical protein
MIDDLDLLNLSERYRKGPNVELSSALAATAGAFQGVYFVKYIWIDEVLKSKMGY